MTTIDKILKDQRAEGAATVMAIGTAVPSNWVQQTTYPDYYFRITNNEHKTELKHKFKRICKHTVLLSFFIIISKKFEINNFFKLIESVLL